MNETENKTGTGQGEFEFAQGDLQGLPWSAIIVDSKAAEEMERSGEVEWTGEYYRLTGRPAPETAISWLAVISVRLESLRLDPFDFRVLGHLIWRAGRRGNCWPTFDQISQATGISRRRCVMSANRLVRLGIIEAERGAKGRANVYRVRADLLADPLEPGFTPLEPLEEIEESKPETVDCDEPEAIAAPTNELFAFHLPANLSGNVDVMLALGRFERSRREMKKRMTPTAIRALCRKIALWNAEDIIAACDRAIESGWLSLYEPKRAEYGATQKPETVKSNLEEWNKK